MDKHSLIQAIRDHLLKELEITAKSAQSAHAEATHPDSKAENKYDTRGLEASYLAGAQEARASQIQATLVGYQFLEPKSFGDQTPISATAWVELMESEKRSFYFLAPHGGGFSVLHEGQTVFVIGPQAPLTLELLGRRTGDFFEMKTKNGVREYEVLRVV